MKARNTSLYLSVIKKYTILHPTISNLWTGKFCLATGPYFSVATNSQSRILIAGPIARNSNHENTLPHVDMSWNPGL